MKQELLDKLLYAAQAVASDAEPQEGDGGERLVVVDAEIMADLKLAVRNISLEAEARIKKIFELQKLGIEDVHVAETMENYGGGFCSALANAYFRADGTNRAKIREAFGEYWEQYEDQVKVEMEVKAERGKAKP